MHKIKKILSVLLALMLMLSLTTVAVRAENNDIIEINEGETLQELHQGETAVNHGTIVVNNGTVTMNAGTITNNNNMVGINGFTFLQNGVATTKGTITNNNGTVSTNKSSIVNNNAGATIGYNNQTGSP